MYMSHFYIVFHFIYCSAIFLFKLCATVFSLFNKQLYSTLYMYFFPFTGEPFENQLCSRVTILKHVKVE